jgi:hypothetical protein
LVGSGVGMIKSLGFLCNSILNGIDDIEPV